MIFLSLWRKKWFFCHCEERSDEAIQRRNVHALDCFATLAMSRTLCVLTKFCFAKLAAMTGRINCPLRSQWRGWYGIPTLQSQWVVHFAYLSGCLKCWIGKMNKCPNARAVVFEAAPEIEHRRRRRPRERRLKAGKMLLRSILSESPSSCAAKACVAWVGERLAKCETEVTQPAAPRK